MERWSNVDYTARATPAMYSLGRTFRESPAFAVIRGLRERGADVAYMDPYVPSLNKDGVALNTIDIDADFGDFDAIVIIADHSVIPRARLVAEATLIIDTRDALHGVASGRARVYGL